MPTELIADFNAEGGLNVASLSYLSYLQTPTAVPPEGYLVDEEFHMNRAPRVSFVEDDVYVTYTHRRYRYVDGELVQRPDGVTLRVLPVEWFYSGK